MVIGQKYESENWQLMFYNILHRGNIQWEKIKTILTGTGKS